MKLSVSAYRAHAAAHKKILSSYQLNYGSTSVASSSSCNPPVASAAGGNTASAAQPSSTIHHPLQQTDLRGESLEEEDERDCDDSAGDEDGHGRDDYGKRQRLMGHQVTSGGGSGGGGGGHGSGGAGVSAGTAPTPSHLLSPTSPQSVGTSRTDDEDDDSSNAECRSPGQRLKLKKSSSERNEADDDKSPITADGKPAKQSWLNVRAAMAYYHSLRKIKRTKSNQRWMKLRTTVQLSSAIQTIQKKLGFRQQTADEISKQVIMANQKPPLKREDSFLKRFSTRQSPGPQETVEDTGSEGAGDANQHAPRRRRRVIRHPRTVVNPDENFYFYWLLVQTICVLYNMWTLIVRQSFPELQNLCANFWTLCDWIGDIAFILDIVVQLRTGYLEQGLMVYDSKKLAGHYLHSRAFLLDLCAMCPLDLLQIRFGTNPLLRFPRFLKVYRAINYYYMVESRTVYPNLWRVLNLIHILLILAHWFGCFYFLLSEAEGFQGDWVYPYRPGDYATLSRKYLGSLYWSTLTLTTIGDLPTPETNAEYVFTIVSYLIGVFIFATIVGQVGNVITNRNANRLEFERLLDGAKTYMRHHKVPGGMKRRVLRWYDYSWSRGRIQGGGDINTALGLLPDKLKTELALHVNLSVLKKVTIFQECQPEFLHDLVLKMKAYIFTPGDTICRKGEVAREMFIIADGILEVLSENGRVLTTMKAGDFFGEIGILCLDGLNKRTADVRSVGYSELFSLSREDVLTAMKDYPEAQEILQALGRKRLMEVKTSNQIYQQKQHASAHHRKPSARWHLTGGGGGGGGGGAGGDNGNVSTDSDANTPRRIVDKIKCEAKGLRKVLRKSRTSRRSGDSIELQPLHSSGSSAPKSVLRRMSRVRSEDFVPDEPPSSATSEPPICSPLGAGLPLLARLRLLKEKQEREECQTPAPSIQSSVHSSIQPQIIEPEPQPEIIGAGLPLLQRLLLLKAKEAKEQAAKDAASISSAPLSPPPPPIIEEKSPVKSPPSEIKSKALKPWNKLKKAAILSDTSNLSVTTSNGTTSMSSKPLVISNIIQPLSPSVKSPSLSRVPDILSSNSNTSSLLDRDNNLTQVDLHQQTIKLSTDPVQFSASESTGSSDTTSSTATVVVRKRKPCMLHIKTKHYHSVDDLSPEYCGLPFVKKLKILNERQKLAELESVVKTRSASLDCPETEALNVQDMLTRSHSEACAMQCRGKETLCVPLDFHPPLSPESNETLERRTLKSILKKLSEDTQQTPNPPELKRLMRAPTIEGYAARHSKLSKSVTFNRDTLQSPPSTGTVGDKSPTLFPIPARTRVDNATQTETDEFMEHWIAAKTVSQVKLLRSDYNNAKSIFAGTESTIPGPLDEVVVGGIKQVIQCHLQEMQNKFQSLEMEVRRRDEIISQLQSRIQELERLATMVVNQPAAGEPIRNDIVSDNAPSSFSESVESQHVVLDLDSDSSSSSRSDYENAH